MEDEQVLHISSPHGNSVKITELKKELVSPDGYIVLCLLEGSSGFKEYVTWYQDREGNNYSGHYGTNAKEALKEFHKRVISEI